MYFNQKVINNVQSHYQINVIEWIFFHISVLPSKIFKEPTAYIFKQHNIKVLKKFIKVLLLYANLLFKLTSKMDLYLFVCDTTKRNLGVVVEFFYAHVFIIRSVCLRKAFKIYFENTRHCLNIEVSELRTYVCKTFIHNLVDLGFTGKNVVFQAKK